MGDSAASDRAYRGRRSASWGIRFGLSVGGMAVHQVGVSGADVDQAAGIEGVNFHEIIEHLHLVPRADLGDRGVAG